MKRIMILGWVLALAIFAAPLSAQDPKPVSLQGYPEFSVSPPAGKAYEKAALVIPQPLMLRFQLLTPTDDKKSDPAIAEVVVALKDLFRYPNYQLLDEAMVVSDTPAPELKKPAQTRQRISGNGETFILDVTIEEATAQGIRMDVQLGQEAGRYTELLRTKITVSFNNTVILGSTRGVPKMATTVKGQISRPSAPLPLILVVRPELKKN